MRREKLATVIDEKLSSLEFRDEYKKKLVDGVVANLIEALIAARTAVGITQSELGRRLGVSPSRVAHVEARRKDPGITFLAMYADVVGYQLQLVQAK